MRRKLHVTIVHNEPESPNRPVKKFVSPSGVLQEGDNGRGGAEAAVDLSEVAVLQEVEKVQASLANLGYEVTTFTVNEDILGLVSFLTKEKPDLVFNLCESIGNVSIHEMHVAGIYEILGLCYTGAGPLTMGLALNKVRAKELLLYHGITTPAYVCYRTPHQVVEDDFPLRFPVIVKPSMEDASIGIGPDSVVDSFGALKKRVKAVFQQHDQAALVEEYIDGRELNVSILGNRRPIILPISEIDFSTLPADHPKILTYDGKWKKGTPAYDGTRGVCPAPLSPSLEAKLKEIALKVYRTFGCRDYARVDFRLGPDDTPYVLEVNPNPDISDDAGFMRSSREYGLTYTDVIERIVEYALERNC